MNSLSSALHRIKWESQLCARYALRDNALCRRSVTELKLHDHYSVEHVSRLTSRLLYRTLRHAGTAIPFYRQLSSDFPEEASVEVLISKLPIITKEDLRAHRQLFYPYGGRVWPWVVCGETSGTTGVPLQVFYNLRAVVWENAFVKRHRSWAGFADGMRMATLRGDLVVPVQQRKPPFWHHDRYNNNLYLSTRHLIDPYVDSIVAKLQEYSPYLLHAYPSAAYDLAIYLRRNRYKIKIPYVFTGSEPVYPHQRELIEHWLQTRVMDMYGLNERVAFATECNAGNLHVNTDYSYVEIVDEQGKPTADYGCIVGTTFHNSLMPLIRYRTTDQTRWKKGRCQCGKPYPMIEPVKGRTEDVIDGSDGKDIGPLLYHVVKNVESIRQSQIAQIGRRTLEIRIVPDGHFAENESQKLLRNLRTYVDPSISAQVIIVNEIPKTQRGKQRWIVNEYRNGDRSR